MSTSETLRAELDLRRKSGERFTLRQIVAMMVPFITELAERHADGEVYYVSPSAVWYDPAGAALDPEIGVLDPKDPRDRACLPPELRVPNSPPGDARASVFSIGALLYEMCTRASVGPGMRRPSEVVKGLPQSFELLLGKALVGDAAHRPCDLGALAQALHRCAPMASIPPPAADAGNLDQDSDFDVDVSLSLLPPPPIMPADAPLEAAPSARGSTAELADMKAALEADPRPRYVVIKEGMDHGPFNAVELLQQLATGTFSQENILRDVLSADEMPLQMWPEFAPFAEHAHRHREVKQERVALEATVTQERTSTQNKALIGGAAFVLVLAAAAGWWFRARQADDDRVGVTVDDAQSIDVLEGLGKGPKAAGGKWAGGKRGTAVAGDHPVVGGGKSCEAAQRAYVLSYEDGAPPDLTAGAYAAVLNRGTYLNSCGVPSNMSVSVCAAVQNGRAVGVTVNTKPNNRGIASCVANSVRGMGFPAHPRLDVARTHFKAN
jgi:hypothetical protein